MKQLLEALERESGEGAKQRDLFLKLKSETDAACAAIKALKPA
jgi:hypothetical protein